MYAPTQMPKHLCSSASIDHVFAPSEQLQGNTVVEHHSNNFVFRSYDIDQSCIGCVANVLSEIPQPCNSAHFVHSIGCPLLAGLECYLLHKTS